MCIYCKTCHTNILKTGNISAYTHYLPYFACTNCINMAMNSSTPTPRQLLCKKIDLANKFFCVKLPHGNIQGVLANIRRKHFQNHEPNILHTKPLPKICTYQPQIPYLFKPTPTQICTLLHSPKSSILSQTKTP